MGIKKDIGLKGDDYQWLGSMFYFGMTRSMRRNNTWLTQSARLSGLGIPYEQAFAASAPSKVLFFLCHHVGNGPLLHGCCEELLRRSRCSFLPWRF